MPTSEFERSLKGKTNGELSEIATEKGFHLEVLMALRDEGEEAALRKAAEIDAAVIPGWQHREDTQLN